MTFTANQPKAVPDKRQITTKPRISDKIFRGVLTTMSMSSLLILTLIGLFLSLRGFQAFQTQGIGFLTNVDWTAGVDGGPDSFGLGAMIIGTLLISATALFVGVPLSVLTALFLTFYAPEGLKRTLVTLVDLMASFPSILYGLWGFIVLMPMAEYWGQLIHKYLGWIPIFGMP